MIPAKGPEETFPELGSMTRLQRVEYLARKLLVILSRSEGK